MKPGRTSAPIVCLIILSVLSRLLYGSQIIQHQIDSQMLAGNLIGENPLRTFVVYLPDGYDEGDERYPVVYWFPGGRASPMAGITRESIDEAIRSGRVPATIIVFMSKNVETFGVTLFLSSDAFGHWEEFLISEVIPFIDDTYRTHANPQTRGIMGFSLGGFPALILPVLHPDTWGAVGLNDPSIWIIPFAVRDWPVWAIPYEDSNTAKAFRTMPTSLEGYATAAGRSQYYGQIGARFSPNPDSPVFADFPRDRQGQWVPDAREKWREFDISDPNIFPKHLDALQDLSMVSIILREETSPPNAIALHSRDFIENLQAAGINAKIINWAGGHNAFVNEKFIALLEDVSSALTRAWFERGFATGPSPADKATDVPRDVVLKWTPGIYAPPINGHLVYFSESFNDVNDRIGGIAQDANSYTLAQRLDFDKTYYWRVAEVNGPPDYTVHQGRLWSFTTEPIGYAIENVTATASSGSRGSGPENTIDGSGLDDSGLLHGPDYRTMWLSGDEPNVWIEYEFDKVCKLHEMWVWNSNGMMGSAIGFGLKDVTIEYSTNGIDYTTLGTTYEFARATGAPDYAHNTTIDFGGVPAKYARLTANSNWGGISDQYGLSEVRFFSIPVYARESSPDSGATDVAVDVTLGFKAGREAETHDVYLSTDEQAVIDSTAPVTTVSQAGYGPLSLDLGTTYYWKINEVNEAETTTTWQGDIWNFSTHEFFVVDDFELYNDLNTDEPGSNRIFYTWIDGYDNPAINGSVIGYAEPPFAEQSTVHGGSQAMPFFYDNTSAAAYSEGERTFAVPQDWTKAGVQTLTLYFYGTPTRNTGGQLYVKVNGSKVLYGGDAADINRGMWTRWSIDLAPLGVDLQSVTTLGIGIDGNGASGTLYFDDIRLYRP